MPEQEVTKDACAVMYARLKAGDGPYADFAIFTPWGRKSAKARKYVTWVPQPNGTYLSKEIAGPDCYNTWLASWRCFVVLMTKLGGISQAAMEAYGNRIEQLAALWKEAWHLVLEADDRMRY